MDFNRRSFLKGVSLTAFAGAASPRLIAEGTTLAIPEMANGRLKPGKLQEVVHEADLCVVGGGMGGMLTAISAARRGASDARRKASPLPGRPPPGTEPSYRKTGMISTFSSQRSRGFRAGSRPLQNPRVLIKWIY